MKNGSEKRWAARGGSVAGARARALVVGLLAMVVGACGGVDRAVDLPAAQESPDAGVEVSTVEIVRGVPDRGRDPAVVALDLGGEGLCSGTLVSAKLVLTARHCVARTSERIACPPQGVHVLGARDPSTIGVLVGETVERAREAARGRRIIAPSGATLCDADIAFLVLDRAVSGVKPVGVRATGVAQGDFVRAVGFGRRPSDGALGQKLLRDHVRVLSVSPAEFLVGEATCQGDSGGPALDDDTGEVVGVVSRGGPRCDGPNVHNVYTRTDAYQWLFEEALRAAGEPEPKAGAPADAGTSAEPAKPGGKAKPPSDVGGACAAGADCAAGVCIARGTGGYCSRPCGTGDRCPNGYHCTKLMGGSVCVATS